MIAICKTMPAPIKLTTTGAKHRGDMERAYDADPVACLTPKSELIKSRQSIYGDDIVKELLENDQYKKCCYCEVRFTTNYYGDVEHFRPKGGYQQDYKGTLIQPGYYWLSYEWSNLYFSCAICNQEYKGNYFPLINNLSGRTDGNKRDITSEKPLLIDLSTEDPEHHITFKGDIIKARKIRGQRSIRGKACIAAYGLDRLDLTSKRLEFLEQLKNDCTLASLDFENISTEDKPLIIRLTRLHKTLDKVVERVEKARLRVYLAAQDDSEFAGMVRALIRREKAYRKLIAFPDHSLIKYPNSMTKPLRTTP